MFKEIITLLNKDFKLEWRQRFALNGVLLYVVCTVFICYLSFGAKGERVSPLTWNALFWIIILFTGVNAIAKSFFQEHTGRLLYYYSIASPQAIILSKIIYNTIFMLLLSCLGYGFYSLVLGNPVEDQLLFWSAIFIGSVGFSTTLTLVSAIAAKAGNNGTLMAILSIPILVPLILMLVKLSKNAMDGLDRSTSYDEIIILSAIDVMAGGLSYILFPYLWRS